MSLRFASALLATFYLGLSLPAARAADKLTMGVIGTGSAQQWAVWIAQKKGFFTANNLELDIVVTPSAAAVMQQILAGAIDIGTGGLTEPVRAIDQDIPVALLGIETRSPPYSLWVKPQFTSVAALKGKTMIVGGAKDITRTYLQRMVTPGGLGNSDYDLIYAGAASARFAALSAGGVDGALLNPPFSFKAKAAGFRNLGELRDFVDMPFTGYVAGLEWAKTNKSKIGRFAASVAKAINWFYDPANRAEAIEIQQAISKADLEDVAQTYDLYVSLKIFSPDLSPDARSLQPIVDAVRESGDLKGAPKVDRFIIPEIADLMKPKS